MTYKEKLYRLAAKQFKNPDNYLAFIKEQEAKQQRYQQHKRK